MYIFIRIKIRGANSHDNNELCLPSRLICQKIRQKTQRCRKNACDGLEMRITRKQKCDRHDVNCGSRNAHCSVYKVEVISLAFKWLIVLRKCAIKHTESLIKAAWPL